VTTNGQILEPERLRRYADAIVKASLGVAEGETLVVQGEPDHREILVAVAEAGYRAGATFVEVQYGDPRVVRARMKLGKDAALGAVSSWGKQRLVELAKPSGARAAIIGLSEPGYLDGIPAQRIGLDYGRYAKATAFYQRKALDMAARWTGAGWPTDYWASQVYPKLSAPKGKRKLAEDILWFCRLADEDGKGSTGWLNHVRSLARRAAKLSSLGLTAIELRGPGTELDLKLSPGTRWLGGLEETPWGVKIAPNMPTEETFTSPDAGATNGEFACTFPLSFQGRLMRRRSPTATSSSTTSTATRPATAASSARSHSSTPPRGSARAAARTSTRSTTRTPPRTSRSAPASAARARRSPRAASTARRSIST
jgi:aminopeptidase